MKEELNKKIEEHLNETRKELVTLLTEKNVELVPFVLIGENKVPIGELIKLPIQFEIKLK